MHQSVNNKKLKYTKNNKFIILSITLIAAWFYFFYSSIDIKDWWMENILVFIFCVMLFLGQRKFIFSNTSIVFIFLFLLLHLYGARMAYTHNELGQFFKTSFHLARNPYDRIVHFSFGFLMMYPLCDYLNYSYKLSKKQLFLISNMIILSLATIFELIEWGVAAFTNSATGETYVATQGDPWDAQKDIILASLGAVLIFFYLSATNCFAKNHLPVTDLKNLSTA
jgi:putative membrane protein